MRFASTLPALLAATTVIVAAGRAEAAPPGGESFDIRYYTTNEDSERSRQFTSYDLQGYVNKARCECGQNVSARIRISNTATDLDSVQIRTFVGNRCDMGQASFNPQIFPCAIVFDAFTNAYTRNVDITFNPLWLATGTSRMSPQTIDDAVAAGSCDHGQGNGGIWICAENGMTTDCQADEFVVTGTQNLNAGTEEQMGIRFDFDAPIVTVTDPKIAGGDGAVEVSWKNMSSGAIDGGFRILCADAEGNPLPGKGFKLSSVTARNTGTIYFTKDNLCPDGPFDEVEVDPDSTTGVPGGGETGDTATDTDGGTGDSLGTGGTGDATVGVFGDDPNPQLGGQDCCATGTAAGCNNFGCQALVCDNPDDPCCTDLWSDACSAEARAECTICGGCCTASGTPGCNDDPCMAAVCQESPECCKVAWDSTCVATAQTMCSQCMDDSTTGESATSSDSGSTATDGATDTDTDGTATDTDTDTDGGPMLPIESLDWAYVCSGYIAPQASSARISGLQNDVEYQVLVVAYDRAGNPVPVSEVLTAIPRETTDLWEQCQMQGGICGEGGFCKCRADDSSPDEDSVWLLVLVVFGYRRRRNG